MADLFLGQTCTELYRFISAGTAHTFSFNFQPDKVVFNNLSDWTATAGGLPTSIWWRDQTTTAHAFQHQVIDSAAAPARSVAADEGEHTEDPAHPGLPVTAVEGQFKIGM
jgi:hypothetical protein